MTWLDDLIRDKKKFGRMLRAQLGEWEKAPPRYVAGSDEAGSGPLAGPLVVVAVMAPYGWSIPGLADSKALVEDRREALSAELYGLAMAKKIRLTTVQVEAPSIDEIGIKEAHRRAHKECLNQAVAGIQSPTLQVADGDYLLGDDEVMNLPKADTFIPQVMAASIVAKHIRDSYMKDMAVQYPGYGFASHKGYDTPEHAASLKVLGPCPLHRRSYGPVKKVIDGRKHGTNSGDTLQAAGEPAQGPGSAGVSVPNVQPEHPQPAEAGRKPKRRTAQGGRHPRS